MRVRRSSINTMVHRLSLAILLYLSTAWCAPRVNSDITYVKIQPTTTHVIHPSPPVSLRESRIENLPLTIGSYNPEEFIRKIRSDEFTSTIPEDVLETTTSDVNLSELRTEIINIKETVVPDLTDTKVYEKQIPGPRFYSKLSYFSKPIYSDSSISTNLISTKHNRKKFRSRCRCEKIWNCPNLQITVPRCPNEYFLCCF